LRILLFGKDGRIGWELQRSLAPLGELAALGRRDAYPMCGDLTKLEAVSATLRRLRPDVIVNAAAYSAVDKAESEPDLARAVNAVAVERLALEATALGALLVHYSSDCVFDGSGTKPWDESCVTRPLNVYGQTKLEGEQLIRASGCLHLIIRTSWIHAPRRDCFARLMLRLASEQDCLDVVNDQFGAPTGAALVADATAHAICATMRRPELRGTYHCVASGFVSRHEYAKFAISTARDLGWPVRLAVGGIRPVGSEAFKSPAKRPLNARLASGKFCDAFGLNLPDWRIGLQHTLCKLVEGQAPFGP
jgi:dTDP-4-dehydrorhamnose reductase